MLPYFCSCSPLHPDSAILPWSSDSSIASLDGYGCVQQTGCHPHNHCKVAKLETLQLGKFLSLKKAVSTPEGFKTSHARSSMHEIPYKFSHEENSSAAVREYRQNYTYPNMKRGFSVDPSSQASPGKDYHASTPSGTVKPKLVVLGKCVGGGGELQENQLPLQHSAPFRTSRITSRPLEYELSFKMRWVSHSIPSWLLPPGGDGSTSSLIVGNLPIPRSITPKWDRGAFAVNVSAYHLTSRSPRVAPSQKLQFHHLPSRGRVPSRKVQNPSKHYFNTSTKTGLIAREARRNGRQSYRTNGAVPFDNPWSEKMQLASKRVKTAPFVGTDRGTKKRNDEE